MKNSRGGGRLWIFALAGGLAVMGLVLLLFRSPVHELTKTQPGTAPVGMTVGLARLGSGDEGMLLKQEATMRDPTPLFLPTRWNAGEDVLATDFRHEFGTSFEGYPPKLIYTGGGLKLNLPPPIAVPSRPADAFASDKPTRPYQGLGESDQHVPAMAPRGAFVRVAAVANGQSLIAEPLQDAKPPSDAVWQPLEFLVAIDRTGVVKPPVMTESSRVAAVDGYFGEYLVTRLHIGERLTPGYYRISFGP